MALNELDGFLRRESWQEAMAGWENATLSMDHREENHTCLRPLTYLESRGTGFFFSSRENASRFREGDRVFVNLDGTPDEDIHGGYQMEWVSYDPAMGTVTLTPSYESRRIPFPFQKGARVMVDQGLESLQDAVSEMLASLPAKSPARALLDGFLAGSLSDRPTEVDHELRGQVLLGWPLNDGQSKAFDGAIRRFPVSGVQGPPGTGKTRVLAALAAYYSLLGLDVLVSSVSHFAINHALNQCADALARCQGQGLVAKISRIKNAGLHERVLKFKSIQDMGSRSGHGSVVGMTPFRFPNQAPLGNFKVLLFDEAGQANLPLAMVAMAYARKTIFIGDHRQLSPIVHSKHHPPSFSPSAFAHLARMFPERMTLLDETYRMGPELCSFPSGAWYGGALKSHPERSSRLWHFPGIENIETHPVLRPDLPTVWVAPPHLHCLKFSDEEAGLIVDWLLELKTAGATADMIAVLVPFRGQQNRILWHLHQRLGKDPWQRGLVVDTVDRLQGQERDIVFYSLTMSDPRRLSQICDFFYDAGRFNVAITRARYKRVLVASPEVLRTKPPTLPGLVGLNYFSRFLAEIPRLDLKWGHEDRILPPACDLH